MKPRHKKFMWIALGLGAIGVATGHYTVADLDAYEAAAVFSDLSATDDVIRAILA